MKFYESIEDILFRDAIKAALNGTAEDKWEVYNKAIIAYEDYLKRVEHDEIL